MKNLKKDTKTNVNLFLILPMLVCVGALLASSLEMKSIVGSIIKIILAILFFCKAYHFLKQLNDME